MMSDEKRDEWVFSDPVKYWTCWGVKASRNGITELEAYVLYSHDKSGSLCLQRAKEMAAAREMVQFIEDCEGLLPRHDPAGSPRPRRQLEAVCHALGERAHDVLRRAGLLDDGGEG